MRHAHSGSTAGDWPTGWCVEDRLAGCSAKRQRPEGFRIIRGVARHLPSPEAGVSADHCTGPRVACMLSRLDAGAACELPHVFSAGEDRTIDAVARSGQVSGSR